MTHWIEAPLIIRGDTVDLISLEPQHVDELEVLARDARIWEFYGLDGSSEAVFRAEFEEAFAARENGTEFPFVIFHKKRKRLIGSTRYLQIVPEHRKLEIGWTWLSPEYWATGINLECKLLLLTHCFETLRAIRVQLKTDENNIRSRKAIKKIGGSFEGIFHNDMIRNDGTKRNSAYYSLIEDEWFVKKGKLETLIQDFALTK